MTERENKINNLVWAGEIKLILLKSGLFGNNMFKVSETNLNKINFLIDEIYQSTVKNFTREGLDN